jgi:hypothetical protein
VYEPRTYLVADVFAALLLLLCVAARVEALAGLLLVLILAVTLLKVQERPATLQMYVTQAPTADINSQGESRYCGRDILAVTLLKVQNMPSHPWDIS